MSHKIAASFRYLRHSSQWLHDIHWSLVIGRWSYQAPSCLFHLSYSLFPALY